MPTASQPISIGLVLAGHFKRHVPTQRIERWSSKVFRIASIEHVALNPNGQHDWQLFTDDELEHLRACQKADLTIALTDYALEGNFYLRRLKSGVIVLSIGTVANFLDAEEIPIENFVVRMAYEIALLYFLYERRLRPTREWIPDILHDETRCCLFDMNGIVSDIIYSSSNPIICSGCHARLSVAQLPAGMLANTNREIRKIKKPLYYRVSMYIKKHPLLSLVIGSTYAIVIGVVSSVIASILI